MKNYKIFVKPISLMVVCILFIISFLIWININQPEEHLVKKVVDGDTIVLENGETVRYIGIDTPETSPPLTPIECFGPEATEYNRELVEGKVVKLIRDIKNKDKYGRSLRYVYLNDIFINLELIKNGYARALVVYPDVSHEREFAVAENKAKKEAKGLWNKQSCNGKK